MRLYHRLWGLPNLAKAGACRLKAAPRSGNYTQSVGRFRFGLAIWGADPLRFCHRAQARHRWANQKVKASLKGQGEAAVVTALGGMSGTSLDGVDSAVVQTDGQVIHGFGATAYRAYSQDEQAVLPQALGPWSGAPAAAAAAALQSPHAAGLLGLA